MRKRLISVSLWIVLGLAAQVSTSQWNVDGTVMPSTPTDLITRTVTVQLLTLSCLNGASGSIGITIKDKQSTPQPLFDGTPIDCSSNHQTWYLNFGVPGRRFLGGINWSASAANSVSVSITGIAVRQ